MQFGAPQYKEDIKTIGVHPEEGNKDGEGSKEQDIRGVAEVPWCA